MIGIYKIKNIVNNKIYIGSSFDIKKRWRDHNWYLKNEIHHNPHLQSSWKKYGSTNFIFEVVEECSVDDILDRERHYINEYDVLDNRHGYNMNDPKHGFLGRKHSAGTKKLLSIRKLGDKNPSFGKFGKDHPKYGIKLSQESRNRISESKIGTLGAKGEKSPNSILTNEKVIEIRNLYESKTHTQRKLAKIFNVSQASINKVVNRISWTEV